MENLRIKFFKEKRINPIGDAKEWSHDSKVAHINYVEYLENKIYDFEKKLNDLYSEDFYTEEDWVMRKEVVDLLNKIFEEK